LTILTTHTAPPTVLNERQATVAVEGVEQHNRAEDRIRVSLLAVDTWRHERGHGDRQAVGFRLVPAAAGPERVQAAQRLVSAGEFGGRHRAPGFCQVDRA